MHGLFSDSKFTSKRLVKETGCSENDNIRNDGFIGASKKVNIC